MRRASPASVDAGLLVVVGFPTAMDAWWNEAGTRQADIWTYALTVVSIGALWFRRRQPVGVAIACGAALSGWYLLGHHGELLNLPTMVALYSIAVSYDRRTTIVIGVVASTWSGLLGFTTDDPLGARGGSPVMEMLWPLVPLALGEATRNRRELLARADAEREREAARRVEAERARISREFHDLVAHTMAAVNVHMGVAVAAFDSKPDTARAALVQARASSKEALQELRATVAVLRDGTPGDIRPVPRLADIGELADTARAAGIDVAIDHDTSAPELPAAVELAGYRIIQEALANVVRHSNARHVAISVRHRDDHLMIDVTDDGSAPAGNNGGYGLMGMGERAAAIGGHLDHGPRPDGGFTIHATLPLAKDAT